MTANANASRELALHRAILSACFVAQSADEFQRDLGAFLRAHKVHEDDVRATLATRPRFWLYRQLIRHNVRAVTERMMPRAKARLDDFDHAFDATLDAFLRETSPRTHYLRDVPSEFLAWATPRWRARTEIPAYLPELAAHELVEFQICAAPLPRPTPALAEVTVDRPLVFAEALKMMRYAWAVHELPVALDDRTAPNERDSWLFVYRDGEHEARFLELTPLAAQIMERAIAGMPLARAIPEACSATGYEPTDAILADTARLLADMGERGVLLGARDG